MLVGLEYLHLLYPESVYVFNRILVYMHEKQEKKLRRENFMLDK